MNYMVERIESEIKDIFPGKSIKYDPNFSPLLINGLETIITNTKYEIIALYSERDDLVYWNEKNQAEKVFALSQIRKYETILNKVKDKAMLFTGA